jgi:short-subunit dehydrogenase
MTIGPEPLKFNSAARRGCHLLPIARNRKRTDLAKKPAAHTRRKVEILTGNLIDSHGLAGLQRTLRDVSRGRLPVSSAGVSATAPLNSDVAGMNRMIALKAG